MNTLLGSAYFDAADPSFNAPLSFYIREQAKFFLTLTEGNYATLEGTVVHWRFGKLSKRSSR